MVVRCTKPDSQDYARYGGRGIRVCERWASFENFLADMGERPSPSHSIDRINNDGDYEPGNCRWATMAQQSFNRRTNKLEQHEPAQIAWLYGLGFKQKEIAGFFGITDVYVSKIVCDSRRGV